MAAEQPPQRGVGPRGLTSDTPQTDAPASRCRASSNASNTRTDHGMQDHARVKPRVPINEAVVSAFDKADTANHVPPELIAQITESVIEKLRATGIENSITPVPASNELPPPPLQQPAPQSPSTLSGSSPTMGSRKVYTPPSPQKHPQYPSESPRPPLQIFPPAQAPTQDRSHTHPRDQIHDRRPSTTSSHTSDASHSPARPRGPERLGTGNDETTLERIWGPLFDERGTATARLGQLLRGLAIHIIEDYEPRHSIVITPAKMVKYYEDVKLSSERYPWSVIFDDEQSSISRMFRQLECSHHLIQERLDARPDIPGLTPVGFQQWVTHLLMAHPEEEYQRLCKAVLSMPISNPDDKKERFPKELSRRLFPVQEDRRIQDKLEHAMTEHCHVELPRRGSQDSLRSNNHSKPGMMDSQTSNASHRSSVAPSETGYSSTSKPVERERAPYGGTTFAGTAPDNHGAVDDTSPDPPPGQRQQEQQPGPSASSSNNIERERAPYARVPQESIIDDTNPSFTASPSPASATATATKPIERERKPYTANPGGGKFFDDELRDTTGRSNSAMPSHARTEPAFPATNVNRSESTAGRSGAPPSQPRPINDPNSSSNNNNNSNPPPRAGRPRPMSMVGNFQRPPPPMDMPPGAASNKPEIHQHTRRASNARRQRSPSFSRQHRDDFRRSDGDFHRYSSQAGSVPIANGFEDGRYMRERAQRRPADDLDGRNFGQSPTTRPRVPTMGGYDGRPPPPPAMDIHSGTGGGRGGSYVPDEDFYRSAGRPLGGAGGGGGGGGNGYDYEQPYGGPLH